MFEWNWADLIIAFLGFLSAIGAAFLTKKISDFFQTRRLKNEICEELNNDILSMSSEVYSERILNGEELNFKLIELPHIEGIFASKQVSLLSQKSWYCSLVSLMNDIEEINKWASLGTICLTYEASEAKDSGIDCMGESLYRRICKAILDRYQKLYIRANQLYHAIMQKESKNARSI